MAEEKPKYDYEYKDHKINFDFTVLTVKEWREMVSIRISQEKHDKLIALICGLEPGVFADWDYGHWRDMLNKLMNKSRDPLSDPN